MLSTDANGKVTLKGIFWALKGMNKLAWKVLFSPQLAELIVRLVRRQY